MSSNPEVSPRPAMKRPNTGPKPMTGAEDARSIPTFPAPSPSRHPQTGQYTSKDS